jgi:hypothetical protein
MDVKIGALFENVVPEIWTESNIAGQAYRGQPS